MSELKINFFQKIKGAIGRLAAMLVLLPALLVPGMASAADWAASYGGGSVGSYAYTKATAVDVTGNVYISGDFYGATLTLGSVTLTRIGSRDAFVAKLDASGNVLWAHNYGGSGATALGQSIAVDISGNVYLGGWFVDAGLTTPALTKIGNRDAFAIKLDSTGATTWAHNYGGSGAAAYGQSIAVDSSGNVYLGGYFDTASLTTPALTKIGTSDVFAIKLDSSGATTWQKNFGGSGASARSYSITVDGSGNVYLGGLFYNANLTTPALNRIGNGDAFAIKLDSTGATTWAHNYGGSGANAIGQSIAVDSSGNVYLGGYFQWANLTTPALTKIGYMDAFAIKIDSTGVTTWAHNYSGSGANAIGQSIAVDSSGNVYLGGYFQGGSFTTPALTIIGTSDAFAIKLDSSGATTWQKNFGGSGANAFGNGIAVDSSGNVYLGGYFNGASLTTPALTLIGSADAFAIKLDSFGNTTWAKNYGAIDTGTVRTTATSVDAAGNIYIAGVFDGSILTLGSVTLSRIGTRDAFVAKLDASGNVLWAHNYGGSGASAWGESIAVDSSGNVYLGGHFDSASLTTPALTKIGTSDAFAIKLDSSGATTWVHNFGGSGAGAVGQSIAVDSSGNVYLGGYFYYANLTTPALTKIGINDAFAIKLDSTGATTWAHNYGGVGAWTRDQSIAVDSSGNVYLAGYFNGASLTTPALTIIGAYDAFAIKLDSTGATTWAHNYGGSGAYAVGQSIAVDSSGNVYLGGDFGTASLTTPALTIIGNQDAFAIKLDSSGATTWSRNYGGSGANAYGNGIAVDSSVNVYLGGYFDTARLTTPVLTKIGTRDAFAIKLDSTGATTWQKNFGGSGANAYGNGIAVDSSGNVYLGGYFDTASLTTPALTIIGVRQNAFIIKQASYKVTVIPSAGAGGTISPSTPQTINYGSTTSFTVTPATGYSISSVTGCGGTLAGSTFTTAAITTNCTVTAVFKKKKYQVTPSAGTGGSISPSGVQTVTYGSKTAFTIAPNTGYTASVGGTCGGRLSGNTYTTNAITANCTVAATFTLNIYTVTPSAGTGGTISPSTPQTITYGSTTTFTVTPNTGYTASVGGTCGGRLGGNTYTTNAITGNCTVIASFTAIQHTLTLTKSGTGKGLINNSGNVLLCGAGCQVTVLQYDAGSAITLSATPESGMTFKGWSGGGCSGTGDCTVTMNGDVSVNAVFSSVTAPATDSSTATIGISGNDISLNVPVIKYTDSSGSTTYFSTDFVYVPTSDSKIWFKLTGINIITDISPYAGTQMSELYYSGNDLMLHLNNLTINGAYLWADLKYMPTNDGQYLFVITGAGGN